MDFDNLIFEAAQHAAMSLAALTNDEFLNEINNIKDESLITFFNEIEKKEKSKLFFADTCIYKVDRERVVSKSVRNNTALLGSAQKVRVKRDKFKFIIKDINFKESEALSFLSIDKYSTIFENNGEYQKISSVYSS